MSNGFVLAGRHLDAGLARPSRADGMVTARTLIPADGRREATDRDSSRSYPRELRLRGRRSPRRDDF
jgi:hypothetical protein